MPDALVTEDHVEAYQRDGVVLVRGLLADHVDTLHKGIEANMANAGSYAAENLKPGEAGRFFDDYCNWTRIAEFEHVIRTSPAWPEDHTVMCGTFEGLYISDDGGRAWRESNIRNVSCPSR